MTTGQGRTIYQRTLDIVGPRAMGRYRWQHGVHTDTCHRVPRSGDLLQRLSLEPTDIHEHLTTLHMLARERGARTILELGTRSGESTVAFLNAVKHTGGRVVSVDIEDCPEAERKVAETGLRAHWTFHKHDDMTLPWTDPIDHLFIDTSHEYEHTKAELAKFEPFVVDGGVITLHDIFGWPDVGKALDEYVAGRDDLRVYRYYNNHGLGVVFKG